MIELDRGKLKTTQTKSDNRTYTIGWIKIVDPICEVAERLDNYEGKEVIIYLDKVKIKE